MRRLDVPPLLTILVATLCLPNSLYSQTVDDGTEGPGNAGPATTITINVEPGAKVPIGTKITLTATLDPIPVGDPAPVWYRGCLPKIFGAVTDDNWNGLTIQDCVGSPGKYRYEIV
ncbi:MAG: hypothetical protein ACK58L_08105, partial [Planctomycetota bacterium]